MTPEQKHARIIHDAASRKRMLHATLLSGVVLSIIAVIGSPNVAAMTIGIGTIWVMGYVIYYFSKHVFEILAYFKTIHAFLRAQDTHQPLDTDNLPRGISPTEQETFDDIINRYRSF